MTFDLESMEPRDRYALLTGSVVPRPIGWISSVDEEGSRNLAPFSYFNLVSATPPTLMVSGGSRGGAAKDTVRNVVATGGFVANVVDERTLEAMNETSVEAPDHVDEFAYANLEAAPSERVAAPRVARARVAFECELVHTYEVAPGSNTVLFGRVLLAHVDDAVLDARGRVDAHLLRPIGRLAGARYATLGRIVEVSRPVWTDADEA